jgi:hypothetical protein
LAGESGIGGLLIVPLLDPIDPLEPVEPFICDCEDAGDPMSDPGDCMLFPPCDGMVADP